jgi:hypothetical protein
MGRGILLWLLGVPIPIIILLALFWHEPAPATSYAITQLATRHRH